MQFATGLALCFLFFATGQAKQAQQTADQYFKSGMAKYHGGDNDGAESDFDRAIELAPRDAASYLARGLVREAKNDFKRAIFDFDRALDFGLSNKEIYYLKGICQLHLGQLSEAIADFSSALDIDPNYPDAYYYRATSFKMKGEPDKALADLDRCISSPHNVFLSRAYNIRGMIRGETGDLRGAIPDFTRSIELNPDDLDVRANRAAILTLLGRDDEAQKDLDYLGSRDQKMKLLVERTIQELKGRRAAKTN
jgi:tetratricopeptide (TPR) repeat protein